MTKQHTHTPGALRAAEMIQERVGGIFKREVLEAEREWFAAIIERETALPELLEALQKLEAMASMILKETGEEGKVLKRARAALAKAKTLSEF